MESDSRIRLELAVNINTQSDFEKIERVLKSKGVNLVSSDLEGKSIQLELVPRQDGTITEVGNVQNLQRFIETNTGFVTVIKGLGSRCSAVAELRPASSHSNNQAMGVVRLSQLEDEKCFVDGLMGGLNNGEEKLNKYSLNIHEYGNLEGDSYANIGDELIMIGEFESRGGKLSIRKTIPKCDVSNIIGRSIALTHCDNGRLETKKVLSAGVVARASIIEANKKQICSCSGKTLWEERIEKSQDEF